MLATARLTTFVPFGSPARPRLSLSSDRVSRAVLNGGWWPRSRDPAAELAGLVVAITDHYGPIRRLILNSHTWDTGFDRLVVGSGTVQIRWFSTAEPSLLVAITESGDQVNLLVVPPDTSAATARTAMAKAADPANRLVVGAVTTATADH
jgi:Family of unknown function (DUF5994)